MKKYAHLLKSSLLLFLLFGISSIAYGQCDANSPNVEITIESVEILAGCDGDPTLDNTLEPSISINGNVLVLAPSNSADGNALGANAIPGVYTVSNSDLVNGCTNSTMVGIGAANGSTMVPVTVDIWEEDGCGDCVYGTGTTCNDDADLANLGTVNVDITQSTGSFASGCYIFNYSVDCPPPCDPVNCTNTVDIVFTSVDAAGCDGDVGSTVEASIQVNGTVYEFDVNDTGNTTVSAANENCAGTETIGFGTIPAGTTSISLTGMEIWEEDGCGNCSYGTGTTCNDDADYQNNINHTIDLTQIGGTISGGCFDFNYEIVCTSLCCLSAGAMAGTATCAGDNAIFNVSFNDSDTPLTYEVFDQTNGMVIGTGMSSPIAATVTGPTTAGPISIIVRDQADPNGCVTPPIMVMLPECPMAVAACPMLTSITSDAAADACGTATVIYTSAVDMGTYGTDYTIAWYENGAPISTVVDNVDGTATWTGNATGCDALAEPTVSAELVCIADNNATGPLVVNATASIIVYPMPDATQATATRDDDVCNYTITHPCSSFTVTPNTATAAPEDAATTVSVTVESNTGCSDTFDVPIDACPAAPCAITSGTWSK